MANLEAESGYRIGCALISFGNLFFLVNYQRSSWGRRMKGTNSWQVHEDSKCYAAQSTPPTLPDNFCRAARLRMMPAIQEQCGYHVPPADL